MGVPKPTIDAGHGRLLQEVFCLQKEKIMSDSIAKRLLCLKDQFGKAKENKIRAEGCMENLMKQLREQHKCNTLEEAETKLKELDKEERELSDKIEAGLSKLETEYDWED